MDLLQEIRELFAVTKKNRAISISSISKEYPAWVLRYDDWFGVGIPFTDEQMVAERFSNVKLWSDTIIVGGDEVPLLLLSSNVESLRYEFATICAQFIDPGKDGVYRLELINNPTDWWRKWKSLLGNSVRDKETYSVLGEMLVYEKLMDMGQSPSWSALKRATHDIELKNSSYEIKTTISRYDMIVTINSQFQFQDTEKEVFLVFCRFEPSSLGVSIDDVLERLVSKGVNRGILNDGLEGLGLEKGCSARVEKYKLLEMKKYKIDEHFPLIHSKSFKNNQYPEHVRQIIYKIELSGLKYENWLTSEN